MAFIACCAFSWWVGHKMGVSKGAYLERTRDRWWW